MLCCIFYTVIYSILYANCLPDFISDIAGKNSNIVIASSTDYGLFMDIADFSDNMIKISKIPGKNNNSQNINTYSEYSKFKTVLSQYGKRYKISINNTYICKNVNKIVTCKDGTLFNIEAGRLGYKIISENKCLTMGSLSDNKKDIYGSSIIQTNLDKNSQLNSKLWNTNSFIKNNDVLITQSKNNSKLNATNLFFSECDDTSTQEYLVLNKEKEYCLIKLKNGKTPAQKARYKKILGQEILKNPANKYILPIIDKTFEDEIAKYKPSPKMRKKLNKVYKKSFKGYKWPKWFSLC